MRDSVAATAGSPSAGAADAAPAGPVSHPASIFSVSGTSTITWSRSPTTNSTVAGVDQHADLGLAPPDPAGDGRAHAPSCPGVDRRSPTAARACSTPRRACSTLASAGGQLRLLGLAARAR